MSRSILAVVIMALLLPASALAQFFPDGGPSSLASGNIEGFTVTGKGFVSARPNRLEIDLEISSSSELSADAIVKYRDAKRRVEEAFVALKLANVAVEERGLLVDEKGNQVSPYFFDSQPNRRAKTEVQLTRRLVVKCSEIRGMDEEALLQLVAKLLDVAQDAGGKVGGRNNDFDYYYYRYNRSNKGLVRFILDDYEKLEEEAYSKAVADAEVKARRLAKLSRVKLKSITAVRELSTPAQHRDATEDDSVPRKQLESARFQEIPVRVELVVRFDVTALPESKEGAGGQ